LAVLGVISSGFGLPSIYALFTNLNTWLGRLFCQTFLQLSEDLECAEEAGRDWVSIRI
jgi:hypothetical protein